MALTIDEILDLQAKILSARTDSETNPNMKYNSIASRNKALNPDYFTGNNTKMVNAINYLYEKAEVAESTAKNAVNKFNKAVIDIDIYEDEWNKLQELMTKGTIVEGLIDLYENKLPESSEVNIEYATNDDIDSIINNLI